MEGLKVTGVTITELLARDILTTALEAGHTYGFGYWGEASNVKVDEKNNIVSFDVTENEPYSPEEQPRTKHVETSLVGPAIMILLDKEPSWASHIFSDDLDGPLAEVIIQIICFEEVLYG